jgi:hypothetical protein
MLAAEAARVQLLVQCSAMCWLLSLKSHEQDMEVIELQPATFLDLAKPDEANLLPSTARSSHRASTQQY